MEKGFSLKDVLFNEPKVRQLASEIGAAYPEFDQPAFVALSVTRFPELELKARIAWLSDCLLRFLPDDFPEALEIILRALPPELDPTRTDDDFGDFIHAPFAAFVAREGCRREYLHLSLDALHQITRRFTAEGAIRPFLNAFPDETLAALSVWVDDPNYHVRRLCSEGTRPFLPWNERVTIPYSAPIPLLDRLYADETRYVTRSVANHLNDLSKIDPDLVIDRLKAWEAKGGQIPTEMEFIKRHALRTLVKRGDPNALALLGFDQQERIELTSFTCSRTVAIDSDLELDVVLTAAGEGPLLVDYAIRFQTAKGTLSAPKVFHMKRFQAPSNGPVVVRKRHRLRGGMTTRKLFPGEHEVAVQVNGVVMARRTFVLEQA